MHDNHLYNLMNQLVVEHKSLWRIKNHYKTDAGSCGQCKDFWDKLQKDKEAHIQDLTDMIRDHMQ